jgi:ferredoxin/flavodoxin---NADP+ reductase
VLSASFSFSIFARVKEIPVKGGLTGTGRGVDPSDLRAVTVTENSQVVTGIFRLAFPRTFDFIPGQLVALTVDPEVPFRFYSIASGRDAPQLEVLYDLVPEGLLTPRFARLLPGDTIFVSPPFGRFVDSEGPACWVAAGTGAAPFISMVRSGLAAGKILVQGSRAAAGLLERGLFSGALGERYFPCCSRETGEGIFSGRTTEWLATQPLPAVPRYLLCGSSRMVVDARDVIIGKGAPFASILGEIYF